MINQAAGEVVGSAVEFPVGKAASGKSESRRIWCTHDLFGNQVQNVFLAR